MDAALVALHTSAFTHLYSTQSQDLQTQGKSTVVLCGCKVSWISWSQILWKRALFHLVERDGLRVFRVAGWSISVRQYLFDHSESSDYEEQHLLKSTQKHKQHNKRSFPLGSCLKCNIFLAAERANVSSIFQRQILFLLFLLQLSLAASVREHSSSSSMRV